MSFTLIDRESAARTGAKRYYTGIPCKKGHIAQRWVCNTACVDCNRPAYLPDNRASGFTNELVWLTYKLKINRNIPVELQTEMFAKFQGWLDHLTEEAGFASARQLEVRTLPATEAP